MIKRFPYFRKLKKYQSQNANKMNTARIDELINSLYGPEFSELAYVYRDDLILNQPRNIFRTDGGAGDRYYYTEFGSKLIFYVSTTTFTKKVMPTSPYLIEWMKQQGVEADKVRDLAADYGTLMHICISDFLTTGYDFNFTRELVSKYLEKLGHHKSLINPWTKKLNKNMASFKNFCDEYEVEPFLIEMMLASDELGIAGTIDLCCKMRSPQQVKDYNKAVTAYGKELEKFNKAIESGKDGGLEMPKKPVWPEKVKAQIDYKSGGIHESAEVQLTINKMIFHENFPSVKLDMLFSWSPKDWIGDEPTYTLKDQTNTRFNYDFVQAGLVIYNIMYKGEIADKRVVEFSGNIENNYRPVSDNIAIMTLAESLESKLQLQQA